MFKRFWAMKEDNLDERELLLRGNMFRNCFFVVLVLLLVNTALLERGLLWNSARTANSATVLAAAIALVCMQLSKGIFPISEKAQRVFSALFAALGLLEVALVLWDALHGEPVWQNAAFTDTGSGLVLGVLFFLPGLCYLLYKRRNTAET